VLLPLRRIPQDRPERLAEYYALVSWHRHKNASEWRLMMAVRLHCNESTPVMKSSVCPVCDAANELYATQSAEYAELQAFYAGNEIRRCWHCGCSFIPEYAKSPFLPAVLTAANAKVEDAHHSSMS